MGFCTDEQTKRLQSRVDNPRKIWKLSDMDLESYCRWYDYARARDDMFAATSSEWAPWHVVHTDDKRRGRLNLITHFLNQVPYAPLEPKRVCMRKRLGAVPRTHWFAAGSANRRSRSAVGT